MASDYYESSDKIVYDGDLAEAEDLNNVNVATDSGFQKVQIDVQALEDGYAVTLPLARDWATADQGTEPEPGVLGYPDEYSARANAEEAADWAVSSATGDPDVDFLTGDPISHADGTTTDEPSSKTSAEYAKNRADEAKADADRAETAVGENNTMTAGDGIDIDRTGTDPYNYEVSSIAQVENMIYNPDSTVNQRDFDGNWSGILSGAFGYDRWARLADPAYKFQKILLSDFKIGDTYTLSWGGGGNGSLHRSSDSIVYAVSPISITIASGDNVTALVPVGATDIQLIPGTIPSQARKKSYSEEFRNCQYYYWVSGPVIAEVQTSGTDCSLYIKVFGGMNGTPTASVVNDSKLLIFTPTPGFHEATINSTQIVRDVIVVRCTLDSSTTGFMALATFYNELTMYLELDAEL